MTLKWPWQLLKMDFQITGYWLTWQLITKCTAALIYLWHVHVSLVIKSSNSLHMKSCRCCSTESESTLSWLQPSGRLQMGCLRITTTDKRSIPAYICWIHTLIRQHCLLLFFPFFFFSLHVFFSPSPGKKDLCLMLSWSAAQFMAQDSSAKLRI